MIYRRAPHPSEVPDPGLQSERTYMAWQRTGLSFIAVGALLVHAAGGFTRPLAALPGGLGMAFGAVILLLGILRYRTAVAAATGARRAVARGALLTLALAAVMLGIAGLVFVIVRP